MHFLLFRARVSLVASALALLALMLAPVASQAQVTLYTSSNAFRAASTVTAPFSFDGYASPGDLYYYGHTYSFDNVFFTSASLKVVSPESGYGNPFSGHQFLTGYPSGPLYLSMSWGPDAFGADFASLGGGPMDITVNGDQVFHFESGATFAGFISRDPITTISVDGGVSGPGINGIMYGDAAPVPEASSLVSLGLLLFGLALGAAVARRRTARQHAD